MKDKLKQNSKKILLAFVLLLMIVICFGIYYQSSITLTQFGNSSMSQMMGYAIHTVKDKNIVIDGGTKEDAPQLEKYILEHGGVVDAWILTHQHKDHIGAFTEIVNNPNITIQKVYVSLNTLEDIEKNEPKRLEDAKMLELALQHSSLQGKIEEVQENQEMTFDNLNIKILGVKHPEITTNFGNNSSIVLKAKIHQQTILFLADTGEESGAQLVQKHKKELNTDYVQVAHHGQKGVALDFYDIVSPNAALWPTPDWLWNNDPGTGYNTGEWKTIETRQYLEKLNVTKHYIEKDGTQSIYIW